jgi:hypothetical protein
LCSDAFDEAPEAFYLPNDNPGKRLTRFVAHGADVDAPIIATRAIEH